jgi:hypothetical protein
MARIAAHFHFRHRPHVPIIRNRLAAQRNLEALQDPVGMVVWEVVGAIQAALGEVLAAMQPRILVAVVLAWAVGFT